jgi:hypothetical protein
VWYAFDFGDGATSAGDDPVVTHKYAAASTPTASVTVTDNVGATDTATAPANPTNEGPTAAFTFSCTFQVCSFDATSSTDPDGPITSYAWDFGDGSTGSGATVGHTFGATATYNVVLVVTDDGGASDQTSQPVEVTVSPTTIVAADDFGRTVTNGWGSAPTGGPYAHKPGEPSSFSVADGVGRMTVPNGGASRTTWLGSTSALDVDVTATVSTNVAPSGSYGQTFALLARRVALNTEYRARVRFAPNGQVLAAVVRMTGSSTETIIGSETVVPGLSWSANKRFTIRLSVTGTNPTTVAVRVWETGQPEPATWSTLVTDSTPALQAPGSVGVNGYLSSSTGAPVVFSVDDLLATSPA